mgnify:CR=1 FL=1
MKSFLDGKATRSSRECIGADVRKKPTRSRERRPSAGRRGCRTKIFEADFFQPIRVNQNLACPIFDGALPLTPNFSWVKNDVRGSKTVFNGLPDLPHVIEPGRGTDVWHSPRESDNKTVETVAIARRPLVTPLKRCVNARGDPARNFSRTRDAISSLFNLP